MGQALLSECFTNIKSLEPLKDSTRKALLLIPKLQRGKLRLRKGKGNSRARVQNQADLWLLSTITCHLPLTGKAQDCHVLEKKGCRLHWHHLISVFQFHYTLSKMYIIIHL